MTTYGLRKRTRFAQWNVRTLNQTGKLVQLTSECKRLNIDVLGISEMRWNTCGEKLTSEGDLILFSGMPNENDPHVNGVGFYFSRRIKNALIDWRPISDRIITARLNSKYRKITIVQCYAPTEDAEAVQKEQFYSMLDRTLSKINHNDVIILMGDFNARIGNLNQGIENVMGCQGMGERNENGDLLIETCLNHNLMIGGTMFIHREEHKMTWTASNPALRRQHFQIDHICVSKRWIYTLLDVRNKRSAEIGSDHYLIVAELRLKTAPSIRNHTTGRKKFQIGRLQDASVKSHFIETANRNYEERRTVGETETLWENFKSSILESANEVLGTSKKDAKEWLSPTFWKLIEDRNAQKSRLLSLPNTRNSTELRQSVSNLTKQIKRQARHDKRSFFNKLAQEAETAAAKGDMKEVFAITRKLSNDKIKKQIPIRDEGGNLISMDQDQLNVWRRHFDRTLNVLSNSNNVPLPPARRRLPLREISTDPPSRTEIKEAIDSMKNGKAAGIDDIPAELLKADSTIMTEMLHPLFNSIWISETIPAEWKESVIVKIPKKGDLSNCNNWRGIALLSVVSKVFNKIILNRVIGPLNQLLRKQQAGFRTNQSCIDNINTMRIIVEQCVEYNSTLYAVFIDYEKAFDSIKREYIWSVLENMGIPLKIINIISSSYDGAKCKVLHNGKLSEPFNSNSGVRQGCLLSPMLFITVLDRVLQIFDSTANKRGITWRLNECLEDLEYADDIVLLSHSHQHMQTKLDDLQKESLKVGLKINISKTESIRIKTSNAEAFRINGQNIADVNKFTYLGSVLSTNGGAKEDVLNRIQKARVAFAKLRNVWRANNISCATKCKIFNSCVKSVLLYGSETWLVTEDLKTKLQSFINRCLRNILQIWWPRTITNEELWRITHQQNINDEIRKRKYGWIGHTLRKPYDDPPHAALAWNPQGTRRRGRPQTTWRRTVLNETGKSFNELRLLARNRNNWKSFVETLSS